jgi:hypothetical protein
MAWNYGYTAQFYDIEVLKYPQIGLVTKNVVIDATKVTLNANPNLRTVIPAGTILEKSPSNAKQVMPYGGTAGATNIVGILAKSVDILTNATSANEPAAAFYRNAIFATSAIVGFTNYTATILSAFGPFAATCSFE